MVLRPQELRAVRGGRALAAILVVLLGIGSCTSHPTPHVATPQRSGTATPTMRFKLMEFNIEYGGERVDFQGVLNAIEAGGASVVAIEEGYGNMEKIAHGLDWPYFDVRTQVVSKYPLLAPESTDGLYTYVEPEPGRVVAIANVHLPSKRYGPFQIDRNHASAGQVIDVEDAVRVPAIKAPLHTVAELAANGIPVFLTGDFNAPSHLDYTQATVGIREQVKFPIDWPVSEVVEKAGLVDSFRAVHPDPVADPGITWPASRPHVPGYNPGPNGAEADRIDFIYSGGPAKPVASVIVGEQGAEGVDITSSPWPTDHRGTVSTFDVTPASPPSLLSASPRLVDVGDTAAISYHIDPKHSVMTAPQIDVVTRNDKHRYRFVESSKLPRGKTDGVARLDTGDWKPGRYEVGLYDGDSHADGAYPAARTDLWVQPRGGTPEISTRRASYRAGRPITATWNFAPGNRWDWVAVYKRGGNPHVSYYKMWEYTHSRVEGSITFNDRVHGFPLDPGEYSVYLLQDDSYNKLAAAHFSVTD
jgi:hypothetical protein